MSRLPSARTSSRARDLKQISFAAQMRRDWVAGSKPGHGEQNWCLLLRFRQGAGFDEHVFSRRVAEHFELAVAGFWRGYLGAAILRYPRLPSRPPRAGMLGRALLPFIERGGERVVRPVLILAARWRIDHARDVAGSGKHIRDRSTEQLGALIDRDRRCDVV